MVLAETMHGCLAIFQQHRDTTLEMIIQNGGIRKADKFQLVFSDMQCYCSKQRDDSLNSYFANILHNI